MFLLGCSVMDATQRFKLIPSSLVTKLFSLAAAHFLCTCHPPAHAWSRSLSASGPTSLVLFSNVWTRGQAEHNFKKREEEAIFVQLMAFFSSQVPGDSDATICQRVASNRTQQQCDGGSTLRHFPTPNQPIDLPIQSGYSTMVSPRCRSQQEPHLQCSFNFALGLQACPQLKYDVILIIVDPPATRRRVLHMPGGTAPGAGSLRTFGSPSTRARVSRGCDRMRQNRRVNMANSKHV